MAFSVILGPREHHNVRDLAGYRRAHANAIGRRRAAGQRVEVHVSALERTARIDGGTWLIDCECGAGNAVDPVDQTALCFGCGAIHEHVVFPSVEEVAGIERALLQRPFQVERVWTPGTTAKELGAESRTLESRRSGLR